jgi:glutathione S-transferase
VTDSPELKEQLNMTSWYSLQSTSLAYEFDLHLFDRHINQSRPYIHLLQAPDKAKKPELQSGRPFFKSEVLRQFSILDKHLATSKSGFISSQGYSYVDSGWAPYTDHYIRKGVGYALEDFPNIKKWHTRVYERPAVEMAYQKLGLAHKA